MFRGKNRQHRRSDSPPKETVLSNLLGEFLDPIDALFTIFFSKVYARHQVAVTITNVIGISIIAAGDVLLDRNIAVDKPSEFILWNRVAFSVEVKGLEYVTTIGAEVGNVFVGEWSVNV